MSYKNAIVRYDVKPASAFIFNPLNPRVHPEYQQRIKAMLDTFGWVAPVLVNKNTGYVLDGHERVFQALVNNDEVPYFLVDIDPDGEAEFLLAFDESA